MYKSSENERFKKLTDRVDFLERWFRNLPREERTRLLVKDALTHAKQARQAIEEKRFNAVLLYCELEDLHRRLAEDFRTEELDLLERCADQAFDEYFRRLKGARSKRTSLTTWHVPCLAFIAELKAKGYSDNVINRAAHTKFKKSVTAVKTLRARHNV